MSDINTIWGAIEQGLGRAQDRGSIEAFSYDGDNDSGEIIVTINGKDYIIRVEELDE